MDGIRHGFDSKYTNLPDAYKKAVEESEEKAMYLGSRSCATVAPGVNVTMSGKTPTVTTFSWARLPLS